MGKRYVYLTCCVDSTAAKVNAMTEAAVEVTRDTFRRHCDERDCPQFTDYTRKELNEYQWHVTFHKSVYAGTPCYFMVHSAIEYVWVPEEAAEELRKQGEADRYARAKAAQGVPTRRYYPVHLAGLDRGWFAEGGGDPPAGESGRGDPGWAEPW